jgi:hypothetical protein
LIAVALHKNIQSWNDLKVSFYASVSTEIKVSGTIYVAELIMLAAGIAAIQVIRGTI